MGTDAGGRRLRQSIVRARDRGRPASVAVVAAHPDDEVVGAGALLAALGETATVIHTTDGAPQEGGDARRSGFDTPALYARARRGELLRALSLAGIPPSQVLELGFRDQETSFHMVAVAERLAELLLSLRPDLVITHPYEGGHPDHDTAAFSVRAACRSLGGKAPLVAEMTSYHSEGGRIRTGRFLPWGPLEEEAIPLTKPEQMLKRRMLDCFDTQAETLAPFGVEVERFRLAPPYDFSRPPHSGRLYYENFDWGLDGERWRALAREVLERERAES